LHDGLVARLLNDVYGIQAREGCACAGTYGHYLLKITQEASRQITDLIDIGDLSEKLGFTRVSFHPVVSNEDISFVTNAIKEIARYGSELAKDYSYDRKKNTFTHKNAHKLGALPLKNIFEVPNL
jgi:selenocysteine lyase/cysteine desulfurase